MADQMQNNKELKNALAQIEKSFGKGAIMQLGEGRTADVPGIPTGALSLDIALGGRGLPRGRIVEIYGPEASGKTTVTLHAVAMAQKAGGVAAFIDAEHALDPGWAKRIGVDLENLLVSQPSNAEEALKIAEMLIKSNAVDIIVVDSVAALVPKTEVEQSAIATILATIDRKLAHHVAKRAALNDLFQTLLHQLMTAQVRVADLDIDTSCVTTVESAEASA